MYNVDPELVGLMRNVGVVDKMLEIIFHARNYDEVIYDLGKVYKFVYLFACLLSHVLAC